MKSKIFISLTGLLLVLCAIVVYIIDPYFHFHKPISNLAYVFSDERYINDGIGRHFDYNAVITGTSMTENFKTSEFDELFSKNSIKVPYSGGSYYEISLALQRMLSRNSDVELVLWGLDYNRLDNEWNNLRYSSYPDYLYDDKIWNDIKYLLNKDSVVQAVRTLAKTVLGGGGYYYG